MKAYGEMIQEPEMDNQVDVVKHQKWSGANYVDEMLKMVSGGVSSTAAMGAGVTDKSFLRLSPRFPILTHMHRTSSSDSQAGCTGVLTSASATISKAHHDKSCNMLICIFWLLYIMLKRSRLCIRKSCFVSYCAIIVIRA